MRAPGLFMVPFPVLIAGASSIGFLAFIGFTTAVGVLAFIAFTSTVAFADFIAGWLAFGGMAFGIAVAFALAKFFFFSMPNQPSHPSLPSYISPPAGMIDFCRYSCGAGVYWRGGGGVGGWAELGKLMTHVCLLWLAFLLIKKNVRDANVYTTAVNGVNSDSAQ